MTYHKTSTHTPYDVRMLAVADRLFTDFDHLPAKAVFTAIAAARTTFGRSADRLSRIPTGSNAWPANDLPIRSGIEKRGDVIGPSLASDGRHRAGPAASKGCVKCPRRVLRPSPTASARRSGPR